VLTSTDDEDIDGPEVAGSPSQPRRRLGGMLRRLRLAARLTQDQAAELVDISPSTLLRIENGRAPCKRPVARALGEHYHAGPETIAALVELARESKDQPWWTPFSKIIPERLRPYISLEADAAALDWYEIAVVPAVLQIEHYTEALCRSAQPDIADAEVDQRITLRHHRQGMLTRPFNPPTVRAVLERAALTRPVGGRDVVSAQLEHLHRVSQLPNVDIRVLPDSVHDGVNCGSSFVVLGFPEDVAEPPTVYVDGYVGGLLHTRRADVKQYRVAFERIWNAATPFGEIHLRGSGKR
jgi:transcriptional regulator with XRE-family HTH domain